MRNANRCIQIVAPAIFLCVAQIGLAAPGTISFGGGDGSSVEKAVTIKGATEETGVHAEYQYLARHFPNCKPGKQSLQNANNRAFDVIEFTTADGQKKTLYFDITAFFGK